MFSTLMRMAAVLMTAGVLAACSRPPLQPQLPTPDAAALVGAITAAGEQVDSAVAVAPLRSPQRKQLLADVRGQLAAGADAAASRALDAALKADPKAPGLLQQRAEVAIYQGHYGLAERLARRSFAVGPKLGALCARNWQTVREMRRLAADPAGAKAAAAALAKCAKPDVVRM